MIADIISILSNSLTITFLVGYTFALWAALVVWTFIDINGRTDSALYKIGSILVVATGWLLGFAIYLLLRPNLTKDELELRDLEEAILASQVHSQACPNCNFVIKEEFSFCTNCSFKLTSKCISCDREINAAWNSCPYCGTKQKAADIKTIQLPTKKSYRNPGSIIVTAVQNILTRLNEQGSQMNDKSKNAPRKKSKKSSKPTKTKRS